VTGKSTGDTAPSRVANPGLIRPPRIFLAAIVLGIAAHLFWPARLPSSVIGIPAGTALTIAAVGLFVRATRAFKAAGTPVPGDQPTTTIVGAGPYRFSRNPIYLAFVLFHLGLALALNSLSLLITLLPAFGLMAVVVIPREERYLEERFPAEYAAYRATVRRWL
jgi:protein-S-isoprenylcysteine O-methyltransferase Ste14